MDFLTNCVGLFFLFLGQNISEKRQRWEGRVNFVLQFERVWSMGCGVGAGSRRKRRHCICRQEAENEYCDCSPCGVWDNSQGTVFLTVKDLKPWHSWDSKWIICSCPIKWEGSSSQKSRVTFQSRLTSALLTCPPGPSGSPSQHQVFVDVSDSALKESLTAVCSNSNYFHLEISHIQHK